MLSRFRSRRVTALVMLAGATSTAAALGAQGPVKPSTAAPTPGKPAAPAPKLIADCDITQSSCGGDPTFGDSYGGGSGDGVAGSTMPDESGSLPICWTGTSKKCGEDTSMTCTQYVRNGGGTITVSGGTAPGGSAGGSVTGTCVSWVVSHRIYYWSK